MECSKQKTERIVKSEFCIVFEYNIRTKRARTTEEKRSALSMPNVPYATVVSVFNHKGGVGKTTLTYHMSKYLASVYHRVLMVDMDVPVKKKNRFPMPEQCWAHH
jgi:Mrp family chromosome partitioning ATPase